MGQGENRTHLKEVKAQWKRSFIITLFLLERINTECMCVQRSANFVSNIIWLENDKSFLYEEEGKEVKNSPTRLCSVPNSIWIYIHFRLWYVRSNVNWLRHCASFIKLQSNLWLKCRDSLESSHSEALKIILFVPCLNSCSFWRDLSFFLLRPHKSITNFYIFKHITLLLLNASFKLFCVLRKDILL